LAASGSSRPLLVGGFLIFNSPAIFYI